MRNLAFTVMLISAFLTGCGSTATDDHTADWHPPGSKRSADFERRVEHGWPFEVEAIISDADYSYSTFDYLRDYFLQPISESRHATQIEKIKIDGFDEPVFWRCNIRLRDTANSVSVSDPGAFWNDADPHLFDSAARYVLTELEKR